MQSYCAFGVTDSNSKTDLISANYSVPVNGNRLASCLTAPAEAGSGYRSGALSWNGGATVELAFPLSSVSTICTCIVYKKLSSSIQVIVSVQDQQSLSHLL